MDQPLRAKEARKKYFEHYIVFEHNIRFCAQRNIDLYKTHNKSLRKIIDDLAKINGNKALNLPISKINQHNNIRNWLAHSSANSILPGKYLLIINKIESLNLIIKKKKIN